ncbi:hypothetical protein Pmar_PMAR008829 [Perkinsus marinus ATCC 50983]|uniref:Uncharacterized protein n=1 Tax=Perkinsus marinus (strain ATCC 50983 / TXsc) TaxID=423536 RepID=C5KQC5_PERM5|nr:hypothetical protein Pmar_PMAR008829 [Perkinsus marinus ATCC 50983]EER13318.1 hypothetical protein Pmar_PMAR008829 [Perkinsus marinus ATCC 50983]|eukprot:XP_002781523.1 hypothetical protein Pmar_PMAR008829 [Perkinsus marinus ATCC 50983]
MNMLLSPILLRLYKSLQIIPQFLITFTVLTRLKVDAPEIFICFQDEDCQEAAKCLNTGSHKLCAFSVP